MNRLEEGARNHKAGLDLLAYLKKPGRYCESDGQAESAAGERFEGAV
ncbi:hypothetical protein [uncultured Imperialibacter sp.]